MSAALTTLVLWLGLAWAGPQDHFVEGVAATRAGDHGAAVRAFQDSLAGGAVDPSVYHGLGNALYRQGRLGPAMAAWRRGLVLSPSNGDLRANLDRARKQTKDRLGPEIGYRGPFFWQGWLSPRAGGTLGALALTGALVLWAIGRHRRRQDKGGPSLWWVGTGLVGGAVLLAGAVHADRAAPGAVVIAAQVTARSALGPDGVDLFTLSEGAEVGVAEWAGDAVLVVLEDERKGWLGAAQVLSTRPDDEFPLD